MAEGADQEDRTEAATPRRLQRAREQGQAPVSRELPVLAGLATGTLLMMMASSGPARDLALHLRFFFGTGLQLDLSAGLGMPMRTAVLAAAQAVAPLLLAVLLGVAAASLLQTGFLLRRLRPDLSRLDPLQGMRRMFGMENLVEAGKSLLKIAVLSIAAWRVITSNLDTLGAAPARNPVALPDVLLRQIVQVLIPLLLIQSVIAGADLFWVRFRHARSLRMSREEIRQETKETEGDPHVKAQRRQIRRARMRRRMMAAVPKATVVVTNPTHYAVALAYDRTKQSAPRVVAKGVDEVAARIRAVAAEHRVPVVANPPLARALYRVELEAEIPAEHFQAAAEIIAYVWRLQGRLRGAPSKPPPGGVR
jgi:flagellar biosynthetic protein FlhB